MTTPVYPGCNENGDLCDSLILYGECGHYDVWRFTEKEYTPLVWDGKCVADKEKPQCGDTSS
jgi:hypothetical protein